MNKRDDFSQKTIDTLCERVGGKCSNPNCRRETKGPHSNPQKRVSIGEAAHITAAAEGGPRYNPDLTPEERSSIENGIWLCKSCARMIDSDENQYPAELLYTWKSMAEYEQFCIINQMDNWLKSNVVFESRKNIACRKAKEALDNLHGILQYAYEYWKHNFENRHYGSFLENELMEHWVLYEDDLKRIYTFQEKRVLLNEVLLEYSLDLGPEICQEINNYCKYLNFSYKSDTCGLYDNYWRCFFEMLSTCFDILVGIKNNVDDILYRQYSV